VPARIVVVDDDPAFADAMASALQRAGHEFIAFADPTAALDALERVERLEVLITRLHFGQGRRLSAIHRDGHRHREAADQYDADEVVGLASALAEREWEKAE
jgi:DNA-binding NtrC family response regulator